MLNIWLNPPPDPNWLVAICAAPTSCPMNLVEPTAVTHPDDAGHEGHKSTLDADTLDDLVVADGCSEWISENTVQFPEGTAGGITKPDAVPFNLVVFISYVLLNNSQRPAPLEVAGMKVHAGCQASQSADFAFVQHSAAELVVYTLVALPVYIRPSPMEMQLAVGGGPGVCKGV